MGKVLAKIVKEKTSGLTVGDKLRSSEKIGVMGKMLLVITATAYCCDCLPLIRPVQRNIRLLFIIYLFIHHITSGQ